MQAAMLFDQPLKFDTSSVTDMPNIFTARSSPPLRARRPLRLQSLPLRTQPPPRSRPLRPQPPQHISAH